jgi:hypothetical protein
VEHGGAPYQHNPARSDSYYVVYRDAGGADHVVWGVDLERAVAESGALAGQQVVLENLGRRLVTVTVPVVDATGTVIGEEEKDVYRNTWQVDVAGQERTQPRAAAPEREREGVDAGTGAGPAAAQAFGRAAGGAGCADGGIDRGHAAARPERTIHRTGAAACATADGGV